METTVLGKDGNPFVEPFTLVFSCVACNRLLTLVPEGEHEMKLALAAHRSTAARDRSAASASVSPPRSARHGASPPASVAAGAGAAAAQAVAAEANASRAALTAASSSGPK